jgi:hypothetical protein
MISNLLNRLLHEFLALTPAINLIIFFWEMNIFLLLEELLQNNIPYFIVEWKQAKQIDLWVSVLMAWHADLTA